MIAQRVAIAAIVAMWSVPTMVTAQHAAESTTKHAAATAKEPAVEHASSPAKKDAAAEPLPQKSPAKEASKDAGQSAAKPVAEHAAAKSDGKKDTGARHVEEAKAPAHASAEGASSGKDAEPATSGAKKVASSASARSKTAPKNELDAALRRIDEQIAAMRTSPQTVQSGKPRVANDARTVRVAAAPVAARIHLSWRTALVWSPEVDGETDAAHDAAHDAPHVALVWPATEPLKSTPITPGPVH